MIVEDEKVVADTLGQILTAHGYEIRVVYSAEDAVEIISSWSPNVAILDVMLPKMNGIELALALRHSLPSCHTLLFSGQPSVEVLMQKAKDDGHHFDVMAKPVHPTVMLNAISTLLCSEGSGHCNQAQ
ncbi:MAG: response regulator [Acidobacteria bacterium]|nr:response regulator [Acidobacteriota bacterium]